MIVIRIPIVLAISWGMTWRKEAAASPPILTSVMDPHTWAKMPPGSSAGGMERPRSTKTSASCLTLTQVILLISEDRSGVVARLARDLADHCAKLTISIKRLAQEITQLAGQLAPAVLALPGCGPLTAAKIIGDTAGAIGSNLSTPTPATTALHPCQSAPRTRPNTDLAAPETGNSTPIALDRAHPSSLMPCFQALRTDQRELTTLAA